MIAQEGFPDIIEQICEQIDGGSRFHAIGCREGCHRGDTCARFTTEALNNIFDPQGHRLFNARHYSITGCYGKKDFWQVMECIQEWNREAWCLMESCSMKRDLYAYDACMSTLAAARNWEIAWHKVGIVLLKQFEVDVKDEDEPAEKVDPKATEVEQQEKENEHPKEKVAEQKEPEEEGVEADEHEQYWR